MKKATISLLIALLALPVTVAAQTLVREYHDGNDGGGLDVEVWVDNEDGIYYKGEEINIFFRASRDCYVVLYSVDTRGELNLLFPENQWENGYVEGGETYSVPGPYADYDLVVSGPEGIEYVQAVASLEELDIPNWYDGAPVRSEYHNDRDEFIEYVNERYFGCRWANCVRAFDQTSIYVKVPRYYYKPVYYPNDWYDYPHYSMIYIDYPYGGEIYIDGIYFGIAPMWIPRVIVGWHWFTIYDRYGYCWEDRINIYHDHTIYLDRSRVKTGRTVVSRYKDIRVQAKKYTRSNYVLSDKPVSVSKVTAKDAATRKYARPTSKDASPYSTGKSVDSRSSKKDYGQSGATKKTVRSWDSRSSGSKKSSGSGEYKSASPTKKSSGSVKKSSGTSKSSGDVRKSSGTTKKSSGTTKKSGDSKSSSSGKKGGSIEKSSSGTKSPSSSSSIGRSSTGRSSSGSTKSGGTSSKRGSGGR